MDSSPGVCGPRISSKDAHTTRQRRMGGPVGSIMDRVATRPDAPIAVPRYGEPVLIRPRLGQGAFRIGVTGVYQWRCAVTGERTLPILDAAHIRPYGAGGDHEITNGLLLRTDIHRLFDLGYVTVSGDGRFQVGRRLKEDFENGRHYYSMHGKPVAYPTTPRWGPRATHLNGISQTNSSDDMALGSDVIAVSDWNGGLLVRMRAAQAKQRGFELSLLK